MKIYAVDNYWEGAIVVIANSLEEAKALMSTAVGHEVTNKIEEYDIVPGFVYVSVGDK